MALAAFKAVPGRLYRLPAPDDDGVAVVLRNLPLPAREVPVSAVLESLVAVCVESRESLARAGAFRCHHERGPQLEALPLGTPTTTFALWLTGFSRVEGLVAPPPLRVQIRQSMPPASEVAFTGEFVAADWEDTGLVVQIAGPLCVQWEVWARIDPTKVPSGVSGVAVELQVALGLMAAPVRRVTLGAKTAAVVGEP